MMQFINYYSNMKRNLILAAALLATLTATAQTEVTVGVMRGKEYGVTYMLPETELEIVMQITRHTYTPGAFCQYAGRYLQQNQVSTEPEEHWTLDNIRAVLEMSKFSKEYQKQRLEEMLDEFGLQHIRKSKGIQLSGGERRRTEIARALSICPKFILLDEPFAGVDPIAVEDIQEIVRKLKDKNIGILITDHNVQETLCITDRAYLLYDGRILQSGTAEDLAADPEVRRVYLGKNFELRRKK